MKNESDNFNIDFIGIGVERAGTTWIFECLKEHPQICGSNYKEVKFFSKKTQFKGEDDKYQRGINYYASYFQHCLNKQIKGEFSPHYFYEKESARRIKKHFPKVKLILCLRNPIERAYSAFCFEKSRRKVNYDNFNEAINNEFDYFIKDGFYSKNLEYYFNLFPKENILILIYENALKNPIDFILKIYKFLEVDESFIPQKAKARINTPHNKNEFRIFLSALILKTKIFLTKFKIGRNLVNWSEKKGAGNLLHRILEKRKKTLEKVQKKSMDSQTRKHLQHIYQSEIQKIEKITGKDLSLWQ